MYKFIRDILDVLDKHGYRTDNIAEVNIHIGLETPPEINIIYMEMGESNEK